MCALRLKRAERVERQQEQLRKLNSDMEEWRKELTDFRQEVMLAFHFPIIAFLLSVNPELPPISKIGGVLCFEIKQGNKQTAGFNCCTQAWKGIGEKFLFS